MKVYVWGEKRKENYSVHLLNNIYISLYFVALKILKV